MDAPHAGVHVEEQPIFLGQGADFRDGVHHALGVAGGGGDQKDGVLRDGPPHSLHVGAVGLGMERDDDGLHPEVLGGLVEGRMGRHWEHHLGSFHFGPLGSGPVPGRFDRQQDAFRPP